MSNRKSGALARQAGSRSVFWDQMRGNNQTSFGEPIPQLTPNQEAVENLTVGLKSWFQDEGSDQPQTDRSKKPD